MTNEEHNTALYQKMFAEQEKFRDWLKGQPPEEVLNHAYEYTIREDILMSLEYHNLSDAQADALMKFPSPLADVFRDFEKRETDHMDVIWDCLESRADMLLEEQRRALRETPVYPFPATRAEQSEPAALQSVALVDGLFGCLFSGIDRNRAFRAGDDARPERIAGPRRRRADRGDSDSAAVYFPDLIRETACDKRADVENVRPSLAYGFVVIVLPCRIPAAGRRGRVRTRRRRRSARAVRRAICGG